ncbi:ribosome biogenesis GTP-binding protein YihA/YsxC [Maricaulaceae bacterium NA33B04]|nr:ribosome biogenesis GTP-binding protein YihA/YsxC [Maricaulaceae bacterium NA33B04]
MSQDNETGFDQAQLQAARKLFAGPCDFMLGVVSLQTLPEPDLPEIAFAGRSNVGKSSLINALTGRKSLARASNEPGRTRELNFFNLGDRLRIVDLPGYGFAKAPKPVVERWTRLTKNYLRGRVNLKRVLLLIDSRHGIKAVDEGIMKALDEAAVSYQVVLTKADKLKTGEAEKHVEEVSNAIKRRPAAFPVVALTSSDKGHGIPELRAAILETAEGGRL